MRLDLREGIQWSVWWKCLWVLSYYVKGLLDFIQNFINTSNAASILVFICNRGYFWTWKGIILLILNTFFFLVRVLSVMFMMFLTFLFVFFLLIFILPWVFIFFLFLMLFLFLLMFMRTWSTPTSRSWFRSYFFRTIPWIIIFWKLSWSFWI